jgi:hypothetical protein
VDAHEREIETALPLVLASHRLADDWRRGELQELNARDAGEPALAGLDRALVSQPRRRPTPAPAASPQLLKARARLERQRDEAATAAERVRAAEQMLAEAEKALARAERAVAAARKARDAARERRERVDASVARSADDVRRLER